MIDHDLLFKELITTFLMDFIELFAPKLAKEIKDFEDIPLKEEYFTDLMQGS